MLVIPGFAGKDTCCRTVRIHFRRPEGRVHPKGLVRQFVEFHKTPRVVHRPEGRAEARRPVIGLGRRFHGRPNYGDDKLPPFPQLFHGCDLLRE